MIGLSKRKTIIFWVVITLPLWAMLYLLTLHNEAKVLFQNDSIVAQRNGDVSWNLTGMVDGDNLAKALDVMTSHGVKPRYLYIKISSGGGPLFEAIRIANMMGKFVGTRAYVDGAAGSAAFLVFLSADQRAMGKNAVLMWHSIQVPVSVTLSREAEAFLVRFQRRLNEVAMKMACVNKELFDIPFKSDKEVWLTKEEASNMCLLTE